MMIVILFCHLIFMYLFCVIKSAHISIIGPIITEDECEEIRTRAYPNFFIRYNDAYYILGNIFLGNQCAAHNITWLIEN